MSFFSQKKKTTSQLRPLSENEIQKKLYGNLRPELLNRQRSAQPSQSQPQPSLSFTQPPVMVKTAPEQAPSPSAVRDLFDAASPIPADSTLTENLQPQTIKKEKTAEKSRLERLAQLAEIEKPAKNKPLRNDPWKKKSILPVLDFSGAGKFAQGIGGKTAGVLGSAGKGLLGVFVVGVAFGMRLLHAFDLRKPAVRRVIYWLAGAAALFSIFMGIHLLNVRREEAMKAPPKAAAKTVKKETPEKKSGGFGQ